MLPIARQIIPKLNLSTISLYMGYELSVLTYRFRGGPIRRTKGGRFGAVPFAEGGRFGVARGADSAWIKLSFHTVFHTFCCARLNFAGCSPASRQHRMIGKAYARAVAPESRRTGTRLRGERRPVGTTRLNARWAPCLPSMLY